ncbi:M23 family metallopeptidase [Phenylobacterium sp.]|uniref:M23 family metallopeptidase n=1 Tax=Phenylobacterium sp. TaxID=1871053 RepID=UPI002FD95CC5
MQRQDLSPVAPTPGRHPIHRISIALAALMAASVATNALAKPAAGVVARISQAAAASPLAEVLRGPPAPAAVGPRLAARQLVWEGKDIDGDGAPDFVNPTGQAPRTIDAYGSGAFGASRDGGHRAHDGVDYVAIPGQPIHAPISGYVSKIGHAYANAPELKFIEISNPALGYTARVFYVDPSVQEGQAVALGATIGRARSLQSRYPAGMTDHVHLEISDNRSKLDATELIVARYAVVESLAGD